MEPLATHRTTATGRSECAELYADFDRLVRTDRRRLIRAAAHYCGSQELAEDAVQSGLLKAWLALSSFRNDSKLSTWITRIVINETLQIQRKSQAKRLLALTKENQDSVCLEHARRSVPSPESAMLVAERTAVVRQLVDHLPAKYRRAVCSFNLEERTIQETARHLGISESAAKTHVFRGRLELQRRLKRIAL